MDPKKLGKTKKLLKRQSRLANLKRIFKETFKDSEKGKKVIICHSDNIYSRNNQFTDLPQDLQVKIESIIEGWIKETEVELNKEINEL